MALRDLPVSPRTRHLVHAFLLVFAVTGVARLEVLPFSAFRLFAEVRTETRVAWELVAVDEEGDEIPIVRDDLPLGYRQSWRLIPGLAERDAAARDEICDAWTVPLREDGHDIAKVRVLRAEGSVRPGAPPPERTLVLECGSGAS